MRFSPLISKYIVQAISPYFFFSWLLLSVILFVQQGSRFSDIFFSPSIPRNLIWQLSFALVPNVIAFTSPMAILVGAIIGLSKLLSDSELVAIRTAGVGNLQIAIPVILLGVLLSIFTFLINLFGVPVAAQIVRKVALQTALYKLESPIEPGVFNKEINGFTIYVKNGNFERGTWQDIFIYNEDKQNNLARLITSKNGRIDTNGEISELVLDNALVTTLPLENNKQKLITETVNQTRFAIQTKRGELLDKLTKTEETPDELGLKQLISAAKKKEGKEKIEFDIIWHRRILLSITPLIFALLGTSLVLKFNRGGKGFGILLALISLVLYYLLALLGEQMARVNQIKVLTASLIPFFTSVAFIFWFFFSSRFLKKTAITRNKNLWSNKFYKRFKFPKRNNNLNLKYRIFDFEIVVTLLKFFVSTFSFLTVIYLIFTAFELWKFAGETNNGANLLLKYLFFLFPFIYIQLAPSSLMIATLATFVIKSRQNEIVTWTAAGRSVYRLLLPCLVLMIFWGSVNWIVQEKVLPGTNRIQEDLRNQIRNRGINKKQEMKFWTSNDNRIYSFEFFGEGGDQIQKIKKLTIFEFSKDYQKIETIYKAETASWEKDRIKLGKEAEKISWSKGNFESEKIVNLELPEKFNPFFDIFQKPSFLNSQELRRQIANTEAESEKKNYEIALEKKYTTFFLPFVITLFTAPFALSLHRKGRVLTVGYAVAFWLLFIGVSSIFEQFGLNGFISPKFSVWSPLFLFSMAGIFFISKIKT